VGVYALKPEDEPTLRATSRASCALYMKSPAEVVKGVGATKEFEFKSMKFSVTVGLALRGERAILQSCPNAGKVLCEQRVARIHLARGAYFRFSFRKTPDSRQCHPERVVCTRFAWRQTDSFAKRRGGFLTLTFRQEGPAEVVVRVGVVGLQAKRR